MGKTNIEWVKNPDGSQGFSWSPVTGCLNNCSYCYARRLANTRLKQIYLANKLWDTQTPAGRTIRPSLDPFYPRFWPAKLKEIYRPKLSKARPRGIFLCDMGDLFGLGVPEDWTRQVLDAIRANWIDRFFLLTKQPQNMAKWSPFPENCFVGVSVTNQKQYDESIKYLKEITATVKFLSIEPLLEHIDIDG